MPVPQRLQGRQAPLAGAGGGGGGGGIGAMGRPADVADAADFLSSDAAAQTLNVDGGNVIS